MTRPVSVFAAFRGDKAPPALPLYQSETRSFFNPLEDEKDKKETEEIVEVTTDGEIIPPKKNNILQLIKPTKHYLFIYGTLKRGGKRHSLLNESDFITEAVTGVNYDLKRTTKTPTNYDFPVLFKNSKFVKGRQYLHRVIGELYHVNDDLLRILDGVEAVPRLYTRSISTVYHWDSKNNHIKDQVDAYMYVGNHDYWENAQLFECPKFSEKIPHLYYPIKDAA